MKKIINSTICIFFLSITQSFAQISTEGNDFWVGFMNNWLQSANNPIELEIYISAKDTTSGTISMPRSSSFSTQEFDVFPDVATKIVIPTNVAMAEGFGIIEGKGIHITTEDNVSVYAMNKRQWSADISVILPTISLGKNYLVTAHWEPGTRNNGDNSDSEFLILATEDNTVVEIIPSVTTQSGNSPTFPFRVKLDKGEIYQVQARGDLTGSQVYAVDDNGACFDFALYAGNRYTKVGQCDHPDGHDHLYAQMYPTNTWGQEFITIPFRTRVGGDLFKIMAAEDNTLVRINDIDVQLDRGEHFDITMTGVNSITGSKPINVSQFSRSQACDGSTSDPFTLIVSPKEQLLREVTFNAPPGNNLNDYYLNVLIPRDDRFNITLDGNSIASFFFTVPSDQDFMYAQIPIAEGNHTLKSVLGFGAYIYGYGFNESFGFSAGASLENLSLEIMVQDENGFTLPEDDICWTTEIEFIPNTSLFFNEYIWDFGDGTVIFSDLPVPQTHQYTEPGTYIVGLIGVRSDAACAVGGQEQSLKKLTITRPEAEIRGPRSVCPFTPDVEYWVESEGENTYLWDFEGGSGTVVSNDSLIVDWGDTNDDSFVSVLPTRLDGCVGLELIKPVRINIQLDPEAPFGPDSLCANDVIDINYYTYNTFGSTYDWSLEGGSFQSDQDSSSVQVNWDGPGDKKIWFYQGSTLDTVCGGGSDTLSVFVERVPDLSGDILGPDQVIVTDTFELDLNVDPFFKSVNWRVNSQTLLDSVAIETLKHAFKCPGDYSIIATVFDSLSICQIPGQFQKTVNAYLPSIDILHVTNEPGIDSTLYFRWESQNLDQYNKEVKLQQNINNGWFSVDVLNDDGELLQYPLETRNDIYSYRLLMDEDCPQPHFSEEHYSILAQLETNTEKFASFSWNEYGNWELGVDHYDVWLHIDDQEATFLGSTTSTSYEIEDTEEGFDYCLSVRAVELGGNNSYSWSNPACASFIPEVSTYNVFTPNSDELNQVFQIDNIERYPNSVLTILNRFGKVVFEKTGYSNDWSGGNLEAGTYFWNLQLNDDRVDVENMNGWVTILK